MQQSFKINALQWEQYSQSEFLGKNLTYDGQPYEISTVTDKS